MSTYLTETTLNELENAVSEISKIRESILKSTGVDILVNDTVNNININKIVKKYDPSFEINFSRNGEDAKSDNISNIELKSTTLEIKKNNTYPKASFAFHAMGKLDHDSYMFVSRDKASGLPIAIFDIRLQENAKKVYQELLKMSDHWYETKAKVKKTSYDVIRLSEDFITDNIKFSVKYIDNVKVYVDYE